MPRPLSAASQQEHGVGQVYPCTQCGQTCFTHSWAILPYNVYGFRLCWQTPQVRCVWVVLPLGKDKAQYLKACFLILPVEHRACDFHRTRRSTFGRSPWISMKRLFPFLQLHSTFPVDSLRVRWVPLFPSFQRLGAFAISPHPGVPSFPGLRLLCPIRLL